MKNILLLFLILSQTVQGQKISDADEKIISSIRKTINYLSDDKLEGRRTGTAGEKLAYEFISSEFKKAGLTPLGDSGTYIQPFDINEGKEVTGSNLLKIGEKSLVLHEDYFPLPYSFTGSSEISRINLKEDLLSLNDLKDSNKNNPHFDLKEGILKRVKEAEKKGSQIFFITDSSSVKEQFDNNDKTPSIGIPVFYLNATGLKKILEQTNASKITYGIEIGKKIKKGHNVIGFINNNAKNTIILGAHYDHLGYGEDHNSLYTGNTRMIHNGADDNASGIAALIELGKLLKKSAFKNNNYAFVAFSGEELGLYGSKFFTEHSPVDLATVNYMINMDMVGRLKDSSKALTVGGFGTSPAWRELIDTTNNYLKIRLDSSGVGPSDHTSFYRKNIPVLFFFTGTHSDYHKPTDDADKINYEGELQIIKFIFNITTLSNKKDKLAFTKTRESASMGKSSFKVTLGIMPDYSFAGNGVRVDGVSEGKAAQKAGILAGDVIYQLGEHTFSDVQTYMQALNKFNKGEGTNVKVKRGTEDMEFKIVF